MLLTFAQADTPRFLPPVFSTRRIACFAFVWLRMGFARLMAKQVSDNFAITFFLVSKRLR